MGILFDCFSLTCIWYIPGPATSPPKQFWPWPAPLHLCCQCSRSSSLVWAPELAGIPVLSSRGATSHTCDYLYLIKMKLNKKFSSSAWLVRFPVRHSPMCLQNWVEHLWTISLLQKVPLNSALLDWSRQTKTWRPNLLPVSTNKALLGPSLMCLFTMAAFPWQRPSWLVVTDMVWLPEPLALCLLSGFLGKKFTDFCSRQSACR